MMHYRIFSVLLFSLVSGMVLVSCREQEVKVQEPEVKIAKSVPPVYKPASDPLFTKSQDTVLYGGKYFTGFRFALYPEGDTAILQSYFNGVEEGFQYQWYPGHKPREVRFYINGKKEGLHQGWWPDGKERYRFEVYNNEYSGRFQEWYASGLLSKDFHYVDGREEGSQKMWWSNGTIRANYVIRDGKKYGLIGLTLCKNPYDTIPSK
ncbi:MAG: hypothetical protein IPP31_11580 [Chitinophagaceae bacterium]|nr:hypothetical protein [Chitinophagaceae bacterium]